MKIESLTYFDHSQGWGFENLEFSKLNLLVGASGVGKTQILRAIETVRDIAQEKHPLSVEWKITFITETEKKIVWEGNFENYNPVDEPLKDDKQKISFEQLSLDTEVIYGQENGVIHFRGNQLPVKNSESILINFFKEDNDVKEAYLNIHQIYNFGKAYHLHFLAMGQIDRLIYLIKNLEDIRKTSLNLRWQLYLLFQKSKEDEKFMKIWDTIQQEFIAIFPQVESINIILNIHEDTKNPRFVPKLFIIEKKSRTNFIYEKDISSGMLKTLLMLAQIYLIPDNSVVLVDELENSLGVNCMDTVLENIVFENRGQFILTSHHPYIINHIPYERWLVVTRDHDLIKIFNAQDLHLGKSKQMAYTQLMKIIENPLEFIQPA